MTRLAAGILAAACLAAPASALAAPGSLYSGPGPRPGPDILYAKPKTAPQLKNHGIWRAKPILVSGASAYRKGEFLYQDYLYDDTGALAAADPNDPRGDGTFARFDGTYSYPSDHAYVGNLADLVELRVKALRAATAFRLTFNSMTDPGLVGTTIAIGNSAEPQEFPHAANVQAPAELFLTVHGAQADLIAADGSTVVPAPAARVWKRRRQVEVRVPKAAWDPGSSAVRLAAGTGLWNEAGDRYKTPGDQATASNPGGAGGLSEPPAFFNLAFRYAEPLPDVGDLPTVISDPWWWRDHAQAHTLASGDISEFHAVVDFAKLRSGERDDMRGKPGGTPVTGPINRILSSRFHFGQGTDHSLECAGHDDCSSQLLGRLLPYAIYVPSKPRPERGYGLTLLLHSLGANYNQFSGSNNQSLIGERGPGSIVITPSGRGTDGWYYGAAGADTFEVWADVARRYKLDPAYTAISGYSMGGYGTYKFAAQFPDLFAAAQPVVGPPGQGVWVPPNEPTPGGAASNTNRMLASVRQIPFLIWDGATDELVPIAGPTAQAQTFDDLGYRYIFDVFPGDHFALAGNDSYQPVADFLGTRRVNRNPAHVSYVVNPTMDFRKRKTVADHAYWLSRLRLRDGSGDAPLGTVDAISRAFGKGDPEPGPTETRSGTLPPGNLGTFPYTERSRSWGPVPTIASEDRLELDVSNLKRVVVSARRARLSCDAKLDVVSDGPVKVKLAGCARSERFD
jgi:predicted esterase